MTTEFMWLLWNAAHCMPSITLIRPPAQSIQYNGSAENAGPDNSVPDNDGPKLVIVTWRDKVVYRRQQQQQQHYLLSYTALQRAVI